MLSQHPDSIALALSITIFTSLVSCQSWNATGMQDVTVNLTSTANDQNSIWGTAASNWSISIGISQSNQTSNDLVTDTIIQQIWTNVTNDPSCRSQLFNTTTYTDNVVCGINFVSNSTSQQAIYERMQNDPGDCSSAISQACRNDLAAAAVNYIKNNSITTPFPYDRLCSAMAYDVSQNLPQSCTTDSGVSHLLSAALGLDLLSANETQRCPNQNETSSKRDVSVSFSANRLVQTYQFDNKSITNFAEQYDYFVTKVSPILVVGYAVNDSSYPELNFLNEISTEMICLRPSKIAEGSRTPSSVPDLSKSNASCLKVVSKSFVLFSAFVATMMGFII